MADYATLLRDHVTLTCRSVDRIFLQAYVPKLQSVGWVCQFLRWQRHYEIPSSAAFGKIGDGYVAEIHRWAKANGVPVIFCTAGQRKHRIAEEYLATHEVGVGVFLVLVAKAPAPVRKVVRSSKTDTIVNIERRREYVNHYSFHIIPSGGMSPSRCRGIRRSGRRSSSTATSTWPAKPRRRG